MQRQSSEVSDHHQDTVCTRILRGKFDVATVPSDMASVQDNDRASEMLDTVNVDTSTTDVDTCGMSEQQREIVTSCHPSGDKQPSSPVYRTGDGNRCEDDSDNLDGLAENMCKSCCISSDGQKESVDAKEETNSTQQKASFVGAKSIEGHQKKVSADQEDIEGNLKKVSAEDEDIEDDQKEVSADDGEIGNGQKDVSVDEEIMDNQKNICVEDESKNNKEKVKEDGTSGDRNDVDQLGVRGQDDGEETKELSVSGSHREGVEHECPSPTDWETGEASDDDDVDDSDAVVVTVTDHHGSDSDEEEVTKVTEDMMCLRLQAHVQVISAHGPGPQGWLPRSPNGKPMPPDYNGILLNVFSEDGLFGNDGQRNDGTRKRDRTGDISMPTKYMPFSDDDNENFIQKLLDDEFVINTDDMATLAEINGVDSPNILSPAEQRVPSPSHYLSAASPSYSCDSASSPIGSNAPSPWHSADDATADDIVSWLDDMVDILDKDLSADSSNTGTLLQQTQPQLYQQNQAPIQLQQHMQQIPVALQEQHQAPMQLQQIPVQIQQHNQTPVQLQQHNQTPVQLQQHNQTPVQLQQHMQQSPVQLQQHNQSMPNWLLSCDVTGSTVLQHQHLAQSPVQLQQHNQAQLQQQNQTRLRQQNQAQLQQQNQGQLQQHNQTQLQQQNQTQLRQQNQTQLQQHNLAQLQQHNQARLQQQNQTQLQQQNQAQLQQHNQAQLQQQNQAQLQQQNQAQLQQQNQAQLQQQNQAQLQQQNQAQLQQQNQAQLQQQNQTQMQQQNQAQLQQHNQAQLQQHTQTQLQQQKQAVEHLQQQIQQLQQQVPLLQRRLQFLQCQKKQAPEHQQQQFDKELTVIFQKYQQLIQFIKQKNQQLQRLQTKSRNKLKPKRYADVINKYPPIQPRPPMVVISPPVMTTVTSQTPTSPALTLIATLSPGNPNSPSSPGVSQGGLSPCLVSSPQSHQVPSSPVQYSPQPLSPQLISPTSPQQLSSQSYPPQMPSPVPSPQQNAATSVKQDAIIVLPGSPVQMSAQQYPQQQTSPLPFSPQLSPQPGSPQMPSPQLSAQPNPAPFVKQELVTTPDHAGPSEFPLNINPDMRTKAERYIAALSLDELKYVDPEDGDNMLHLAVIQKMPVMLVALVSRCVRENILGSLINSVNRLNQTPLYIATVMNLPEIVAYLLSLDANPNIDARVTVNGLPPINQGALHCAARKGHAWFDTLAQLLKSPHMDIDKKDSDGQTPLHCAMMTHGRQSPNGPINSKDMIKLLMSHEADLNTADGKSGKTPLHYAIERKDLDLLEFVLDLVPGNSAKILNTPTYDGNCSLHIAVGLQMVDIEQHKKIVRLLMRRGADASHKNNSRHLPRELVANRNQEIINILRGVNTTLRTTSQSNPMLTTNHIILAYPYQQV